MPTEPKKIVVIVEGGVVRVVYAEGRQDDIKVIVVDLDAKGIGNERWSDTCIHGTAQDCKNEYPDVYAETFGWNDTHPIPDDIGSESDPIHLFDNGGEYTAAYRAGGIWYARSLSVSHIGFQFVPSWSEATYNAAYRGEYETE